MKRYSALLAVGLAIVMVAAMAALSVGADKPAAPAKGKEVTVTGRLSCTMCTLTHPEMPCDKGCCQTCIKAGDPALLTDAKGDQYMLLSGEMKKALMTDERMPLAGGHVKVKGMLVKGKGVQAIIVDTMEKAAEPPKVQAMLYTCSMHPDVVQDHPGNCPKCGMKLVPKK